MSSRASLRSGSGNSLAKSKQLAAFNRYPATNCVPAIHSHSEVFAGLPDQRTIILALLSDARSVRKFFHVIRDDGRQLQDALAQLSVFRDVALNAIGIVL